MPCENCSAQFTVFKRKRICTECRRYYCNQCLKKLNSNVLCERCVIFTKRPLSKIDLLKLKPKDLIFYLQSKHISTTGCVEKEELVNLILIHVNTTDSGRIPHNMSFENSGGDNSHPFDNLKQTCQNFFHSFTEKISNDFSFDAKTSPTTSNSQQNISDQPRISTREIPTYSSYQSCSQHDDADTLPFTPSSVPNNESLNRSTSGHNTSPSSPSSSSSTTISLNSISSHSNSSQQPKKQQKASNSKVATNQNCNSNIPSVHSNVSIKRIFENVLNDAGSGSGCECSDDEIITKFQSLKHGKDEKERGGEKISPTSQTDSAFDEYQMPGPSGSAAESSATGSSSPNNKQNNCEESSGSSFEELGAVGGGTQSDSENWQFVSKLENEPADQENKNAHESVSISQKEPFPSHSTTVALVADPDRIDILAGLRQRRIIRRRSDGFIYHNHRRTELFDPEISRVDEESDNDDEDEHALRKRLKKNCNKCGKSKKNIKRHVAKFKRHLESSQMSEAEIKRELEEFLAYLENRAKSFDCSDSESNAEIAAAESRDRGVESDDSRFFGDDDGIHVYAHNDDYQLNNGKSDNRFISLDDFRSSEELEELSVKQLKEILMLNRVDYKGCCEKQELLERVNRLWNNLQACPAVDKLPTDELCKICMDAPIECVILECGHMATCTNCGKVLSECPICRQYIVRVVRFFRA